MILQKELDDFYMMGATLSLPEEFALRMALSGKSTPITIHDLLHYGAILRIDDMYHKVLHALTQYRPSDYTRLNVVIEQHRQIIKQNPTVDFAETLRRVYNDDKYKCAKDIMDTLMQFSEWRL